MKNLLKRVMSIAAATALLMTSVISASAAGGHAHRGDDDEISLSGDAKYTITLTKPAGVTVDTDASYGAYQIFTGTIPENLDPTKGTVSDNNYLDPGSQGADNNKSTRAALPITDIKWGNAFGDVDSDTWQKNIVGFVIALAKPYLGENNEFKSAFADFDEFADFIKTDTDGKIYLADDYVADKEKVNADSSEELLNKVNYDKLATAVADIVAKQTSREWLQAFTDILGGYGEDYGESEYGNKGFVTRFYESKPSGDSYTIGVPESGYYMILDRTVIAEGAANEAFSARMLFVVNNVTQVLKEDIPTLEKEISRDSGYFETEAAGVGDEVNFRLTGTLPSNYDQYTLGYEFIFTDTLSKGLSLKNTTRTGAETSSAYNNDNFKVTVKGVYIDGVTWNDTKTITISAADFDPVTHTHSGKDDAYTATVEEDKEGNQIFKVEFPCLKEISIKGSATNGGTDGETYTLGVNGSNKSIIYIDYTAVVNENAVVSPKGADGVMNGNTNKATLTYSDNPQSYGDTDTTTPDNATVYTFGVDIVKVDAAEFLRNGKTDGSVLANAKFSLVRPKDGTTGADTTWQIASFDTVTAAQYEAMDPKPNVPASFKNGYYTIIEWEDISSSTATAKGDKFNDAWLSSYTDNKYKITSLSNGALNISGLDDGITYTLVETDTPDPDDYAKIDPFTFSLTAATTTGDEYTGRLSGANSAEDTTGAFSFDKPVDITDTFGATDDGSAKMLVANFKYTDLPSTGGIGVYIYYIAGGCAVVLALVLFALSKKKRSDK